MSAFLQQLPALIGVVIGALGSYLAVVHGDRVRFRREREARWQERRFTVYADYARAVKTSVTLTYRGASALGLDPHPQPLPPREADVSMAAATAARDPHWEALLLLGSPEVVERARAWVVVLMDMERLVRDERRERPAWQDLLERQRAARADYYAAVRADLGLPTGHSARLPLPTLSDTP
ncbi:MULTISPECIES: hypothetical protein [Streptomyces]|uniref:hypothetical protein n=1 Tax=Streptomyces TaxID=1883 RepID=UPI00052AD436|nr:hypothetical protein [Streptomyces sp. CCM_MD2014]AIV32502.1 hypothetical protein NI25_02325 [Streptomyces sp. CCM_MD2014]MDA4891436.1 hypothetical protein [Streptomyces sp. MS2A]